MSIRNRLFRIVFSFLVVIASLFLVDKFNILSGFAFIPPDKSYSYCVGVYASFIEGLGLIVLDIIEKKLDASINVIFSEKKEYVNIANTPRIRINKDGIAHLFIDVQIEGEGWLLKSKKIVIKSPGQLEYQLESNSDSSICVDSEGNIVINIGRLCGNQSIAKGNKLQYKINLISNVASESGSCVILPEKLKFKNIIKYKHNSAEIIIGR